MSSPVSIAAMCWRGSSMASSSAIVSRSAWWRSSVPLERDLRHRVLQHAGTDRMAFGVIRVEQARRATPR